VPDAAHPLDAESSPTDASTDRSSLPPPHDAGSAADARSAADASTSDAHAADGAAAKDSSVSSDGAVDPNYRPCTGSPCKIMPLGDSITQGLASTVADPGDTSGFGAGYRAELFTRALADSHAITFVGLSVMTGPTMLDNVPFPRNNEGHSGFTIANETSGMQRSGITELAANAVTMTTPDIILLMIGTNDVADSNDLANAPARLGHLIDVVTGAAPHALVIVATIIPQPGDNEPAVPAYNAAVAPLVTAKAQAGLHVAFVDMFTAIASIPNYGSTQYIFDGVHPNDAGYATIGDTWYAAVAPYLP
jgi:lysophospholipase L1-like esterase